MSMKRNAVHIAAVRTQVYLVVPHLITVNIRFNVPANTVVFVQIYSCLLYTSIHYNCVGTIEIPTVLPLPIPEVSVNTRKGVVVNYAPCELAV